jgi:hypothetical protein
VKLVGEIVALDKPLVAAISNRACVAYAVDTCDVVVRRPVWPFKLEGNVDRFVAGGAYVNRQRIEQRVIDFWLRDESGMALVRGEGATLRLAMDKRWGLLPRKRYRENIKAVEARSGGHYGLRERFLMEYSEGVLQPGDRVEVEGVARREPKTDTNSGYREMALTLVVSREPLQISKLR